MVAAAAAAVAAAAAAPEISSSVDCYFRDTLRLYFYMFITEARAKQQQICKKNDEGAFLRIF